MVSKPGLKLRVISTPNGKGNKFYELMTGPADDGWSRHTVDIYQAVADGLPRDIEELKRARATRICGRRSSSCSGSTPPAHGSTTT